MAFAEQIPHFLRHSTPYVVGCAMVLIVLGLYTLITMDIYEGIVYTLIGISFITAIYLKRRLMFVYTTIVLAIALWIIIFKPGDDTAKMEIGVQQAEDSRDGVAVDQAAKPNNSKVNTPKDKVNAPDTVLLEGASGTLDALKQLIPPDLRDDPTIQKMIEVTSSDSFQKQLREQAPQTPQEYIDLMVAHGVTELAEIDIEKEIAGSYDFMAQKYQAENPGKVPKKEDEAMAKRIGEVLKEYDVLRVWNG